MELLLLVLLPTVLLFRSVDSIKEIKIAFFIEDDNEFELSTLAIVSAMRNMPLYKMSYILKPQIFTMNKTDVLKIGDVVCGLMEEGVAAIFGPESPEINEIIQSVSAALQVPQFQTLWNPKLSPQPGAEEGPSQVFNLHPGPHALGRALATLVKINDWRSYIVIHEDDDGLLRLQDTLKQRKPGDAAVAFRKLGPKENYRSVLKEIKNKGVLHFILDCKTDHILDILREAKDHNLLSPYHSYILTNLDAHTLDWSGFNISSNFGSNITTFRLINTSSPVTIDAVNGWNLLLNYRILETIRNYRIEKYINRVRNRYPHGNIKTNGIRVKTALMYDALNLFLTAFVKEDAKSHLMVTPLDCKSNDSSKHGLRISNAIRKNEFKTGVLQKPLTGPIRDFTRSGQRSNYELEVLDLRPKGFTPISVWNSDTPDHMRSLLSSESWQEVEQKAGKNLHFNIVSRIGAPYLMEKSNPAGGPSYGNDRFEGYSMDLMKEICKTDLLNCTYKFRLVEDGQYGKLNPKTKKWNGLIKELIDLKADLAICDLTITYERRSAVDFTTPFMTLGIGILFTKAKKEPPSLLSFSHPLSLDIWLYMATAYLVISLIIFLAARLNPNDWENPHPCDPCPKELENIWSIRNCLWLTLGSIMAQGCDILPKGISTRMVTSMWWFFSLVMTACYTANMAAFLTMEQMGPTIESAEDLATQTKIKYGCLKDGATASFFKNTNITLYQRMWQQMESADPSVFEEDNKDGVKRVKKDKRQYAFLMESSSIEYELVKNCDELIQVGKTLDTRGFGIAMPNNARYRKSMNEAILKLQEGGVLSKLKTRWWKEKNGGGHCTMQKRSDDDAARELGLDNVGGVFVVLAAGICIAFVIAVGEFLWSVRKVAVVEHLTPGEAFQKELKFAMNIWARKKAVFSTKSREISRDDNK